MSGLENLEARLAYNGGGNQAGRMNVDKLRALKKALLYSYQAQTIILEDGRLFRCLINADKMKEKYEDKIISIPFEEQCLGSFIEETQEISMERLTEGDNRVGMKPGDVFRWREDNDDYWLVFLRRSEETAYFRAEIRRCMYKVKINDNIYPVYVKGPSTIDIDWNTRRELGSWNDLNYDATMYITKNKETEQFLHRFTKIEIKGKPWEIQGVDNISMDGIITVALKETYSNTLEKKEEEYKKEHPEEKPVIDEDTPHIAGAATVYPYDDREYTIVNAEGGSWEVSDKKKVLILKQDENKALLQMRTGLSGQFKLFYKRENEEDIVLDITIETL